MLSSQIAGDTSFDRCATRAASSPGLEQSGLQFMSEIITLAGAVQGALVLPERVSGLGVLVLTGSSGRVDLDRARLFADRGAVALRSAGGAGRDRRPGSTSSRWRSSSRVSIG